MSSSEHTDTLCAPKLSLGVSSPFLSSFSGYESFWDGCQSSVPKRVLGPASAFLEALRHSSLSEQKGRRGCHCCALKILCYVYVCACFLVWIHTHMDSHGRPRRGADALELELPAQLSAGNQTLVFGRITTLLATESSFQSPMSLYLFFFM